MSKTFRKFPEIIIHPPENVTASMPDITIKQLDSYTLKNCSVNENNLSCPDLIDETIYAAYNKPLKKTLFDSYSSFEPSSDDERFNVFNDVEFNFENCCETKTLSCVRELRDLQKKLIPKLKYRTRKVTINPSDILKNKLKQSVSMHNLFSIPTKQYNNYHTVHSSTNLCCDFPITRYNSFDSLNQATASFKKLKSDRKKVVIYKCCCGMSRCKAVVPIQQYLETYFDKRVSEVIHTKKHWFLGLYCYSVACFVVCVCLCVFLTQKGVFLLVGFVLSNVVSS